MQPKFKQCCDLCGSGLRRQRKEEGPGIEKPHAEVIQRELPIQVIPNESLDFKGWVHER